MLPAIACEDWFEKMLVVKWFLFTIILFFSIILNSTGTKIDNKGKSGLNFYNLHTLYTGLYFRIFDWS